jgi:hypothetical protein
VRASRAEERRWWEERAEGGVGGERMRIARGQGDCEQSICRAIDPTSKP